MESSSETSAAAIAARSPAAPPPTMTMSCSIVSTTRAPGGGPPSVFPLHGDVRPKLHVLVFQSNETVAFPVGQRVAQPVVVIAERVVLAVVPAPALVPRQGRRHQGFSAVEEGAQLPRLHQVGVVDPSLVLHHRPAVPLPETTEELLHLAEALLDPHHSREVEQLLLELVADVGDRVPARGVQESP